MAQNPTPTIKVAPPEQRVNDEITLCRYDLLDTGEIMGLVDDNRSFWGRTLPWVLRADEDLIQKMQLDAKDRAEQGLQAPYGAVVLGALAGVVSLSMGRKNQADMGYYTGRRWLRQGITAQAASTLRDYGLNERNLNAINLYIRPGNRPSTATARSLGAHQVGKVWKEDEEKWMRLYDLWRISKHAQ